MRDLLFIICTNLISYLFGQIRRAAIPSWFKCLRLVHWLVATWYSIYESVFTPHKNSWISRSWIDIKTTWLNMKGWGWAENTFLHIGSLKLEDFYRIVLSFRIFDRLLCLIPQYCDEKLFLFLGFEPNLGHCWQYTVNAWRRTKRSTIISY